MNPFETERNNAETRERAQKKIKKAEWNALEVVIVDPKPALGTSVKPIRGLAIYISGAANNALMAIIWHKDLQPVKNFTKATGIANWRFQKPDPRDRTKAFLYSPDGTKQFMEEQAIMVLASDFNQELTDDIVKTWVKNVFIPNYDKYLKRYARGGKDESIVIPETANWITRAESWSDVITDDNLANFWKYGIAQFDMLPDGTSTFEEMLKAHKNYLYSIFAVGNVPIHFINT